MSKFKVGDKVKARPDTSRFGMRPEYVVDEISSDNMIFKLRNDAGDLSGWVLTAYFELVEAPKPKFKVGDKIEPINERFLKPFVVTGVHESGNFIEVNEYGVGVWLLAENFKLVCRKQQKGINMIKAYFRTKSFVVDGKVHRGNKVGQVRASINKEGLIEVLYHFCDTRFDEYNEYFPMNTFQGNYEVIPFAHRDKFVDFLDRAAKYFRQAKFFSWVDMDCVENMIENKEAYVPEVKEQEFKIVVKSETENEVIVQISVPEKYLDKELVFRVGA